MRRFGPAAVTTAAFALAAVTVTAGCNEVGGAGSWRVCGQPLFTAADMPVDHDVSTGPTTIEVSTFALLRVAPDCTHGVDVAVTPAAQGQVVSRAAADDGRTAGMFIRVSGPQVRLTITRPDGSRYDVVIVNHEVPVATPTWHSEP